MDSLNIIEYKVEKAIRLLICNISEIRYIKNWADRAFISTVWLNKIIKKVYNKNPKEILCEVRFEVIVYLIDKHGWDVGSISIAIDSGKGHTSDALYKFLKRSYGTTFSKLKEEVLSGKRNIEYFWLNKLFNENQLPASFDIGDKCTDNGDNFYCKYKNR